MTEIVLARTYDLSINTGTDGAPVWTPITGIQGVTPGQTSQRTDDTDFDTDGWEAHTVVMRGRSLSVSMLYREDPSTGARDAGQAALITAADATGASARKGFKYVSPAGKGWTFKASVDLQWPGGDKVANAQVTADLTLTGAPTVV